ncbi:MAG: NUDIX domain-containing protein [Candidatus Taylorbacteria bacterium]
MKPHEHPAVGLGIILVNKDGYVLVGKRISKHAPGYSIPGGKLELGETFEQGAIREVKEETNLDIFEPTVIAVTNNLETYKKEGKHFISVILLIKRYSGELKVMEPTKCENWIWVDPHKLPEPHFEASRLAISCYLNKTIYEGAA